MARRGAFETVRPFGLGLVVLIFGVYLGMLVARGQAPDWDAARDAGPGLRCLDPNQDLGLIYQTDDLEVQFHLVNDHPRDTFQVTSLRGSCACTSLSPTELTLAPGEKATVTAHINLEGPAPPDSFPRQFTDRVIGSMRTGAGEEVPLQMSMKGMVRLSYRLAPAALAFGTVVRGDRPEKAVEIECLSPEPVERMEVVSAPQGIAAHFEPPEGGGKAFRLVTAVKPDAPYGRIKDRVRFRAVLPSGPFVTRSVGVTGGVVDDLYVLPPAILFATARIGEQRAVVVTLGSHRGEGFTVEAVGVSSPALEAVPADARSQGLCTYTVRVSPASPGPMDETVSFALKGADGRTHVLEFSVKAWVPDTPTP